MKIGRAKYVLYQILVLVVCAIPLFLVIRSHKLDVLMSIPWQIIVMCAILTFLGNICSGIQYYTTLRSMGCKIEIPDIALYPYMQSFWGLVIPFQGSSLFALTYLKIKYKFKMVDSVVMILFLYLINFIFGGIAGIACAVMQGDFFSILSICSLVALGMPFYLFCAHRFLKTRNLPLLPMRYQEMLKEFFGKINFLITNYRELMILIICQIARQFCHALVFLILADACNINAGLLWGYLIAVGQELSIILKFTPGNLGLAEMVAGVVSGLTEVSIADGIMVSLYSTLMQLIMCLCIGGIGNFRFFRRISVSLSDFVKTIKR